MDTQKLERLAQLGTATVYEASGREGLIDIPLTQVIPKSRVAGPARTVLCGQGDNVMVHAAIEHIQPGEIVVLAMPRSEPVALIGDLLVTQMKVHGVSGVLTNSSVRDFETLQAVGLPIWAEFVRVRGATKNNYGRLNVPVTSGGTIVYPGDIVVMDADGAVAIKLHRLDEVLEKAEARAAKEEDMRQRFLAGERSYDSRGWREGVEENMLLRGE
jgi:4-hydroxy-4-methyl-2-oxoglutarate aldolase